MTLAGPVVLDIVQHFVERWNEVKTRKVSASPIHATDFLIILTLRFSTKMKRK